MREELSFQPLLEKKICFEPIGLHRHLYSVRCLTLKSTYLFAIFLNFQGATTSTLHVSGVYTPEL